jgi:dipeptide/tripeptide permease
MSLRNTMIGRKLVIITGAIIMIMGIIFHFQGLAIIGPKSSFMYSNPDWITHGTQIFVLGSIILGVGIVLNFIKKN